MGAHLQRQDRQPPPLRRAAQPTKRCHQEGRWTRRALANWDFSADIQSDTHHRPLASSPPWQDSQPADAGRDRPQLGFLPDGLRRRPAAVRRHLLPRRRSRGCHVGGRLRVPRAGHVASRASTPRVCAPARSKTTCRSSSGPRKGSPTPREDRAADSHLQLPGLRGHRDQRVPAAEPLLAAQRRQRRLLLVAPAADHQHAAEDRDLQPLAVHGRHPPRRLARREEVRRRRPHRRGSALRGRRRARALQGGDDRPPIPSTTRSQMLERPARRT